MANTDPVFGRGSTSYPLKRGYLEQGGRSPLKPRGGEFSHLDICFQVEAHQGLTKRPNFQVEAHQGLTKRPNFQVEAHQGLTKRPNFQVEAHQGLTKRPNFQVEAHQALTKRPNFQVEAHQGLTKRPNFQVEAHQGLTKRPNFQVEAHLTAHKTASLTSLPFSWLHREWTADWMSFWSRSSLEVALIIQKSPRHFLGSRAKKHTLLKCTPITESCPYHYPPFEGYDLSPPSTKKGIGIYHGKPEIPHKSGYLE